MADSTISHKIDQGYLFGRFNLSPCLIISYCILFSALSIIAFRPPDNVSPFLAASLLIVLYTVSAVYGLSRPTAISSIALLTAATTLGFLIVIDPLEFGLFGRDPYHSVNATHSIQSGQTGFEILKQFGNQPAIMLVTLYLHELTGIEIVTVAKYFPLVNALIPVIVYAICRRLGTATVAILAAHGAAGVRTLIGFESKFVPEAAAIPLLFCFFLVLHIHLTNGEQQTKWLALLLAVAIPIGHHVTTAALVLVCGVWMVVPYLTYFVPLPTSPFEVPARDEIPTSQMVAITGSLAAVLFTVLFLWVDTRTFTEIAIAVLTVTATDANPVRSQSFVVTFFEIYGQLSVVLIFAMLNLLLLHPSYQTRKWEFAWAVYNGLLICLFAIQSVSGKITDLDQMRLIIFVYPTLLFIGFTVLFRFPTKTIDISARKTIAVILLVAFLVTQLGPIAPHIYYSDPGDAPLDESHFSASLHHTAEWSADNDIQQIETYERDLWAFWAPVSYIPTNPERTPCSIGDYYGDRHDANIPQRALGGHDRILSTNNIDIYQCKSL